MPTKKKSKYKTTKKRINVRKNKNDLNKILMNRPVSFRLRGLFMETYEAIEGVYRGLYRFNGAYMIAVDEVDDNNLSLRRRHFYLDDVSEIVLEGNYIPNNM